MVTDAGGDVFSSRPELAGSRSDEIECFSVALSNLLSDLKLLLVGLTAHKPSSFSLLYTSGVTLQGFSVLRAISSSLLYDILVVPVMIVKINSDVTAINVDFAKSI